MKSFDDLSDANPQMVKTMEREKQQLYNQLRDLEWRLDQESKAYHKANDERKQYVLEINATKGNIDGNKARQRAAVGVQQREVDEMSRSPRLMGNIPEDQRIIDPRRGPIKKTAAVKNLPSLELRDT
ncbi:CC169-like protein [Mya arenaria]|uniref:CC169-like protein n=1 Tax=Mya arenaria TaxID=6604 RepID=A0ABY7DSY5_MYAAR|nr:CC169-like protein [Mya arenaria]